MKSIVYDVMGWPESCQDVLSLTSCIGTGYELGGQAKKDFVSLMAAIGE